MLVPAVWLSPIDYESLCYVSDLMGVSWVLLGWTNGHPNAAEPASLPGEQS